MKPARVLHGLLLLAIVGAWGSSGCDETSGPAVVVGCGGCGPNTVCQDGRCVSLETTVMVLVDPPLDAELSRFVGDVQVSTGGPTPEPIRMAPSCTFSVRVEDATAPGSEVAAEISFQRRGPLSQLGVDALANSIPSATDENVEASAAISSVTLSRSETYDAVVRPRSTAPPVLIESIQPTTCTEELSLILPAPRVLRGRVFNALDTGLSVERVRVWARSLSTEMSTPAVVTNPAGFYALPLPSRVPATGEAETFTVFAQRLDELESLASDDRLPSPSWRFEGPVEVPAGAPAADFDIPLEPTGDIAACSIFEVRAGTDDLPPVFNAEVAIRAKGTPSNTATFHIFGVTDPQGRMQLLRVDAELFQNDPALDIQPIFTPTIPFLAWPADVVVMPPNGSAFGPETFDHLEVNGPSGGFQSAAGCSALGPSIRSVVLSNLRPRVSGRVVDLEGSAVANAQIRLVRSPSSPSSAHGVDVRSDASGSFSTFVDPGTYVLSIASPRVNDAQRGLHLETREVDEDVDLGSVRLPPVAPFVRMVVDPEGTPLPRASVTVFTEEAGVLVNLAGGLTDDEGFVSLFLPARLEAEVGPN
ncbi:MAG: carboxypeptidase-like regulatory domain-containing protein [Myxococcota bacterium]